jgi:hypothetical protein
MRTVHVTPFRIGFTKIFKTGAEHENFLLILAGQNVLLTVIVDYLTILLEIHWDDPEIERLKDETWLRYRVQ